jgi:hypothetical protein
VVGREEGAAVQRGRLRRVEERLVVQTGKTRKAKKQAATYCSREWRGRVWHFPQAEQRAAGCAAGGASQLSAVVSIDSEEAELIAAPIRKRVGGGRTKGSAVGPFLGGAVNGTQPPTARQSRPARQIQQ